jgi:hypothetical protein
VPVISLFKRKQVNRKHKTFENMKTKISKIATIALFALIILVGNINAKGTELDASSHENIEATLELENWMIDADFWDTGDNLVIETTNDEALELESWMTNENTWQIGNNIELETEQLLVLEPWMINENIWNK